MTIDIIFAEFDGKFKPNVDNIKHFFPEANVTVNTCPSLFDQKSPYWGYYQNDYWKVKLLLESKADIAICFDADIKIVRDEVRTIIPLVKKFGFCLPANPRKLVKIDTEIGSHSDRQLDDTLGMAYALNMTPIAFNTKDIMARGVLDVYCDLMLSNPVRGPLNMWRAIYQVGVYPCLLPPQWCVCAEDVGIGNEIILHIGHEKVRNYYGL